MASVAERHGRVPQRPPLEILLAVWRRRKWLALAAFAVPLAAVASALPALPNVYRASATILVERQQVPEAFVRPTVTGELETRLQTISQEILSRSRLTALIARFNLYPGQRGERSSEELVERLRGDIGLSVRGGGQRGARSETVAFTISYRGSDPQTVANVTNTLASFYIEENLKVRERQATGTAEFLRAQLEETKKRLEAQERQVGDFKRKYMGELPQQTQANLTTLEQIYIQLRRNGDSQVRLQERQQTLERQLSEIEPVVAGSGPASPDAVAVRLAQLRQELTDLQTRFSDKYPDVIRVKGQIEALERELQARPERPSSPAPVRPPAASPAARRLRDAILEVESELRLLKGEEARLRQAVATYQQRVENSPRRELEFQELSRDYSTTREQYQSLLKRHEEAQLAESMEQRQKGEQFRLLDPAVPSGEPFAPDRRRLLAMGLALSVGLAAAAVLLAEQIDTSYHTLDDLRVSASVPILATIPRIVTGTDRFRRRWRMALVGALAAVLLVGVAGASYAVARGNEQLVTLLSRGKA